MLRSLHMLLADNPYNIKATEIGIPTSTGTVGAGLANILNILMLVVGMLVVVFIIYAALQMTLSVGSPQRFAKAREQLLYAVVGLAVALGAFAIVKFVLTYVK
jgi:hypothetical protein